MLWHKGDQLLGLGAQRVSVQRGGITVTSNKSVSDNSKKKAGKSVHPPLDSIKRSIGGIAYYARRVVAIWAEDTIADLSVIIDEAVELQGERTECPVKRGDVTTLEILRSIDGRIGGFIDKDFDGPKKVRPPHVFAILSLMRARDAEDYLAGLDLQDAEQLEFPEDAEARYTLALEAALEAAEALVEAHIEIRENHPALLDRNGEMERRAATKKTRAETAAMSRWEAYLPLHPIAFRLFKGLCADSKKIIGYSAAAKSLQPRITKIAITRKIIGSKEEIAQGSIERWIKKGVLKQSLKRSGSRAQVR